MIRVDSQKHLSYSHLDLNHLIYLQDEKNCRASVALFLELCQVGLGPAILFICRVLRNEQSAPSVWRLKLRETLCL